MKYDSRKSILLFSQSSNSSIWIVGCREVFTRPQRPLQENHIFTFWITVPPNTYCTAPKPAIHVEKAFGEHSFTFYLEKNISAESGILPNKHGNFFGCSLIKPTWVFTYPLRPKIRIVCIHTLDYNNHASPMHPFHTATSVSCPESLHSTLLKSTERIKQLVNNNFDYQLLISVIYQAKQTSKCK